ncbi:hypothetical protein GCM10025869_33210 [Homoserinibacter gongjuensis]|uniref:Capsular polysaccharide biosynthesis protein n=1 Tax=Homoserinibacter gongjuensis TaxID=1162968 RepID=A0ABQ6K1K1_9MICO|nr:hypothetical protein GCM10025869_33210 [Homoserinibacter gongjuensis]
MARVKSYPDLVVSPRVLRATIDQLDLDLEPRELAQRLSASNPRDTVLLTVTASAGDPELSARISDAVARNVSDLVGELESDVDLELTIPAIAPTSPASPQTLVLAGLGLLAGLALGGIAVAVLGRLDPRARSVAEIRRLTGLPVVGQLPPAAGRDGRAHHPAADTATRALLVNERLLTGDRPRRLVVLVPATGMRAPLVTHTALTLGHGIRDSGHTVALICAEPPAPSRAHAALLRLRDRLPNGAGERAPLDTVTIAPAHSPERQHELLKATATAVTRHDVVIVVADAPSDVFALGSMAGAEVLVLSDGRRTTRTQLVETVTSLDFAGSRALGVLVTNVGGHDHMDLPATWMEADRVELPTLAVSAPPARRARSTRHRRPAANRTQAHATPTAGTGAAREPGDAAETADDTEPEPAATAESGPEPETLPGLELVFDEADTLSPEPEPEPV